MLYTSEQVRWPDGCSNKWGEMSEALLRSWAVRRTSPAPPCQHRPRHAGAERALLSRHKGNRHRDKDHLPRYKDHLSRDDHYTRERPLCAAWTIWSCLWELLLQAKTSPKYFLWVFSSWMVHMAFAINPTPKISKIALNGELLAGFQNHNLTMLHLILIISITLFAWQYHFILWVMIPHCCLWLCTEYFLLSGKVSFKV